MEGCHKEKNMFFVISGHFFSKCTILVFDRFFSSLVVIQSTKIFSESMYLQDSCFWCSIIPFNYQKS